MSFGIIPKNAVLLEAVEAVEWLENGYDIYAQISRRDVVPIRDQQDLSVKIGYANNKVYDVFQLFTVEE